MGKNKKWMRMIVALLCTVFIMQTQTKIYGEDERYTGFISPIKIEENATGSLEVSYVNEGTPISGITYELYMIAEFDVDGKAYFTEEFWEQYSQDTALDFMLEKSSDKKLLAEMVEGYVMRYGMKPAATAVSNKEGIVTFKDLKLGYYLARAEVYETDDLLVRTEPSLIAIPSENTNGTYYAEVNAKFTVVEKEEETQDFEVLKKWIDDGQNRPETIKVQLLRDGEPYGDVVSLGSDNEWKYTWHNLSVNHTWSAIEVEVPKNYTIHIEESSNTKLQTNITNKAKPTVPHTPPTSDDSNVMMYVYGLLAAVFVIKGSLYMRNRNKRMEGEIDE